MLRQVNLTSDKTPKRALLSYLESPVQRTISGENIYPFSNYGLAVELVRGLNQCGYLVDVIDWNASKLPKGETYDVFVGHGGLIFDKIVKSNAVKRTVYFASGSAAAFHNAESAKRTKAFNKRHDTNFHPDRPVDPAEQKIYSKVDGLICLGNDTIAATFPELKSLHHLNIAASPKAHLMFEELGRKQKHVLFFSGGGNIHKGLDLAIEAVIGTDIHLHICTAIDPKFQAVYEQNYSPQDLANIHWHGFVQHNSRKFRKLIRRCQFVVLLSCSEGSPGSLIDVMQYGLLPMVTPACGLDMTGAGFIVKDIGIANIKQQLMRATGEPRDEVRSRAQMTRELVEKDYSLAVFNQSLRRGLKKII